MCSVESFSVCIAAVMKISQCNHARSFDGNRKCATYKRSVRSAHYRNAKWWARSRYLNMGDFAFQHRQTGDACKEKKNQKRKWDFLRICSSTTSTNTGLINIVGLVLSWLLRQFDYKTDICPCHLLHEKDTNLPTKMHFYFKNCFFQCRVFFSSVKIKFGRADSRGS